MTASKPLDQLFDEFRNTTVGVIGDVMLDTYWWGHVDRISPEAPVPVVALDKKEHRIGGAGNVTLNLSALGARTALLSVIGNDDEGAQLSHLLQQKGIDTRHLLPVSSRPTTTKTRIISRNQQMLRLDAELTNDLAAEEEARLLAATTSFIEKERPSVLIFEDYNKGVLTDRLIQQIISLCRKQGVITAVDPKRKSFFSYQGVDIFKPNLKEIREALNLLPSEVNLDTLKNMHEALKARLGHRISLITLSEKGIFCQDDHSAFVLPSHMRNIADVSGAGDTVIALASLVYAVTRDTRLMAAIANIAGGLVCEEVGTAAVDKQRLLEECRLLIR